MFVLNYLLFNNCWFLIFDFFIFNLFILRNTQVVIVCFNFCYWDKETLLLSVGWLFFLSILKSINYVWNIPDGIEITTSNLHFSSNNSLIFLCAFEFPNNTPSGTITAHLPLFVRRLNINSKNKSSVFFVCVLKFSPISDISMLPLNGGFAKITS